MIVSGSLIRVVEALAVLAALRPVALTRSALVPAIWMPQASC